MLEHFEQQLKSALPLSEEDVVGFVDADSTADCGTEVKLTEYYTSKIGQRMLFYLLWSDKISKYKIVRSFENDIESELKDKKFVDMSAATPRFR